mmetsp:Transcript_4556/g.20696  ORF Transcript_4556/g.20696 Transcript_4556/m.20696 type:complete len:246 (+) Transcript_4556:2875-3612(+)
MVPLREQRALDVLALHDVDVGHVNLVHLVIVGGAQQGLVRRGQRERRHPRAGRLLDNEVLHALVELLLVRLFVDAHGPVGAAAHKPADAVGNHAVDTLRIAPSARYRRLDLVELDDQQLAAVCRQDTPLAALGSLFPAVRHLGVVGKPTVRRVILTRARLGGRELHVRERPDPGFRALERAEEALARARRQTGVVRGKSHLADGARVRSERLGRHARELLAPLPVPQRHVPLGGTALRDDPLAVG